MGCRNNPWNCIDDNSCNFGCGPGVGVGIGDVIDIEIEYTQHHITTFNLQLRVINYFSFVRIFVRNKTSRLLKSHFMAISSYRLPE